MHRPADAGRSSGNIRFALNNVSTSGVVTTPTWPCRSRSASASAPPRSTSSTTTSLERVVRRAEDLARLAPENPEFMPAVATQTYTPSDDLHARRPPTITPEYRAEVAADLDRPVQGAEPDRGRLPGRRHELRRLRQQQGQLRLPARDQPGLHLHGPHRGRPRLGLGRAQPAGRQPRSTPTATSSIAMRKASASAEAKALEPGKYTVILEPAAAAGLISLHDELLRRALGRRRPQLPVQGGRRQQDRRTGLSTRASTSTPTPGTPRRRSLPWDDDGLPRERMAIVKNGKVANLNYSRYWAAEAGQARHRPARAT